MMLRFSPARLLSPLRGYDEEFAEEILPKLPETADTVVLKFRFYTARADWVKVVRLFEDNASLIPSVEEPIISITAKLAAIRIGVSEQEERRQQIAALAEEAASDPRASIVVADFARQEEMEDIAEAAFLAALEHIDEGSHVADRLMVALHANRRGDAKIVADLLDGRIAEDHDNDELRMLARAFVNDRPIRQRALAFFERLPEKVRALPYFLHVEGLLHFNRGALPEAENALRKAAAAEPDLDNFIPLFFTLHRLDRGGEVRKIVDSIDLTTVKGTPGQKMFLAQVMRKLGQPQKALQYGYAVLQSARNDQKAALRYFGLIMMYPEDGLIPPAEIVATDTWVRLKSDQREDHAFLIEEGTDRPADDVVSSSHPMAAAALGRRVGDEFEIPTGLGNTRRWRVVEIKHKYLHALHDIMENFENRFPDAEGFYTIPMQDGDIQPALDQVRRAAESSRKLADLYLKSECPISVLAANAGRDTIRFAEYIRFLDFEIRTCFGVEAEGAAARGLLNDRRHSGAVLDTYTAWTVATMDAFDVLKSIFGTLIVPQTVIDEIRSLRDDQESTAERSMTVTWHNGEYIRQEHTAEDIAARRNHVVDHLTRIETACSVRPVIAPDHPTDLAAVINQSFGSHVLDAANLAGENHILVSEDMHYRQLSEAACAAKGVWLQAAYSFARENGLIDHRRYVDLVVKLAWRRHGHLTLNAEIMLAVLREETGHGLENFGAIAYFIGARNADLRSHIKVSIEFLNRLWKEFGTFDIHCMRATSILLDRIIRYRTEDWALILAFIKRGCSPVVRQYVDSWVVGHFLSAQAIADAAAEIESVARGLGGKSDDSASIE